ncbi:MAG: DUF2851 family protein [Bacteroidales bacterium]|jgi:hypothetical protein|nr:DUF2851 family protein [Bacteroidales bacterium]
MNEYFLQYIWQNKLFATPEKTTCGKNIKIISVGTLNRDAGPDFFNAKVEIDNTVWAGNIEIHKNSSDWYLHNHHNDKTYNNVILHIVKNNDKVTISENGITIPAMELKYDTVLEKNYTNLLIEPYTIHCKDEINKVNEIDIAFWMHNLTMERVEYKTNTLKAILKRNNYNWEESFYQFVARYFGFNTNALPFEMMARCTPQKIVAKERLNIVRTEALMFGQAGMLSTITIEDDYIKILKSEYVYLQQKYDLHPIGPHLWRFMRMRPQNFPTVRIAQFSDLLFRSVSLFSKVIEENDIENLRKLFNCTGSEYWENHYILGKASVYAKKQLGPKAVDSIIINVVVPALFAWSDAINNSDYKERAINMLEQISAENNSIIEKWRETGIVPVNASDSQALIHLYNEYCTNKRCIECRIGHQIIKA